MEHQVLNLLEATLDASGPIRNDAERHLEQLYTNETFPVSLLSIASHESVKLVSRQAALLYLKKLVLKTWSPSIEEYEALEPMSDAVKDRVRQSVLAIATSNDEERRIIAAASYVVSKIASADFPEQWPSLLPTLLSLVPRATDAQLHGCLMVLGDLVDDGFDEEQFSASAVELFKCIYDVAINGQKKLRSRALAILIFRSGLDTMEVVYQTNQEAVNYFMQTASDTWTPFFIDVVKMSLPAMPIGGGDPSSPGTGGWRGVIALKTQVIKALDKMHTMFPQLLAPRTLELFGATWQALQAHLEPYHILYTGEDNNEGQLEDADRLPMSLDFLVVEELDYVQTLLSTAAIKHELDTQLAPENAVNGNHSGSWITQILALAVGFSYVTAEDANMWEFDVNCFLAEETSETADYSARNACAGLVSKLCTFNWPVVEGLLDFSKTIFETHEYRQGTVSPPK